ncbi:hypothetical protein [Persephonella sp.]|uniref:hypothetical protein n=1 Tax=Persephonella sp. TaxID=2060922 RepID=UPI002626CD27|nr:hypothetical protein [Persephonella sp.]
MKNFKYEELKEIRRGFGVLFILVLTYLGNLLKGYVKNSSPNDKENFLVLGTFLFLTALFIGLFLITITIWKKGEENG